MTWKSSKKARKRFRVRRIRECRAMLKMRYPHWVHNGPHAIRVAPGHVCLCSACAVRLARSDLGIDIERETREFQHQT